MRKVIFQYWIPAARIDPKGGSNLGNTKPGTNCFSEPQSGYFHGWGYEMHEDATTMVMSSIALIEHCNTGYMHNVEPGKMRFVTPPEKEVSDKQNIYQPLEKEMD